MSQKMFDAIDIDALNSHDEYDVNIIGLQYDKDAPKDYPFIEYDFYPFQSVSPIEIRFYKFCIDFEESRKLVGADLVISHWHMHSQKEGHFQLGYTFYDRILIVLGRHVVYWYLEPRVPFPTLKFGVIMRSYWFCNITVELVELFLSIITEKLLEFS